MTQHSATFDSNESRQAYSDKMTSTDGGSEVVKPTLYSHSAHRCERWSSYRNFRVKQFSPVNFSRCFIFVAQALRQKLKPTTISFKRYACTFLGPDTMSPLERSWSVSSSDGMQCRYPCRFTDREGTAIGYLKDFTHLSQSAVPSVFKVCFCDCALELV